MLHMSQRGHSSKALRETSSVILCLEARRSLSIHSVLQAGTVLCIWTAVSDPYIFVKPAGFVRLAAQQGASLVPVLAFGELDTLRNFVDLPAVQVHPES